MSSFPSNYEYFDWERSISISYMRREKGNNKKHNEAERPKFDNQF